MTAAAQRVAVHDVIDVGTPFYAPTARPGEQPGPPVLHKFDRDDFVRHYLDEVAGAAAAAPGSLLGAIAPPPARDVDTDALDFMGRRFRKLYQPAHYRFYLTACQLRCLVPGFPAPTTIKVKKVEFVIRRVALRRDPPPAPAKKQKKPKAPRANAPVASEPHTPEPRTPEVVPPCALPEPPPPPPLLVPAPPAPPPPVVVTVGEGDGPVVDTREWAWVEVPDPSLFPAPPPAAALELASRLTGNTHTWWPIPRGEEALEGEERFPMSRVPKLADAALYFGYVPTASGEMYGPRQVPLDEDGAPLPQPTDAGAPALSAAQITPAKPLVPTTKSYALRPATIRSWRTPDWRALLGVFNHKTTTGPRPKFESPELDGEPTAGWAYVIRCVATLEPEPGCIVEQWGPPSEPVLMAPFYDPFGGRPTRIELPSIATIKKMLGGMTPAQLSARGGLPLGISSKQRDPCYPTVGDDMLPKEGDDCPKPGASELCFWPIFVLMIVANLMINIAIAIMIIFNPFFKFFLSLKFCIGLGGNKQ